jgi:2,3-diketo-5-methylthio-1-phosphopentane phosphatase
MAKPEPGPPSGAVPLTEAGPAPSVPPLAHGTPPLSILVDYDGTISLTDVTEQILAQHVAGVWEDAEASYDAGRMGSRRLMTWEVSLIDADPDLLRATAAAQPHDPGFVPFVRRAQAAAIPVEIVSDGYGFFIEPALQALGVAELPVVTARTVFEGHRATIEFPNGHPTCLVCGTCKRERVLAHRAAGRRVVYIGDGESDRYAAGYSDIVFAKRSLERICLEADWPFHRWTAFSEIDRWLAETIDAWNRDSATIQPVAPGAPPPRGYFCGPEIWGEGLEDPPPGSWPPK